MISCSYSMPNREQDGYFLGESGIIHSHCACLCHKSQEMWKGRIVSKNQDKWQKIKSRLPGNLNIGFSRQGYWNNYFKHVNCLRVY